MNTVKEEAIESIENLDENATWDDLFYTLYIRKKVSEGLDDIKKDNVISHEEAKERLFNRWKSSGQKPA